MNHYNPDHGATFGPINCRRCGQLFNLLRPEGCDIMSENRMRVNITHDEDGEWSASWGNVGAHADTEDKALRLLARFVLWRGNIANLPIQ